MLKNFINKCMRSVQTFLSKKKFNQNSFFNFEIFPTFLKITKKYVERFHLKTNQHQFT